VKYRDIVVHTTVETDGRFVSTEALPTWQAYAVYIGAPGYRPFVSRNPGFDVPSALVMTNDVGTTSSTQTFHYDAYLFPASLKAPAVAISVEKSDATTAPMTPARAAGTIRLRPQSASLLEGTTDLSGLPVISPTTATRRWVNDEDLLNQTITRPFTDGRVMIAEGELAYGVPYQLAIFDVKGYQPLVLSGQQSLVAGTVTSRSVVLPLEQRDPLRILSTTADTCVPPSGQGTDFGATIKITFSETVQFVGTTWAEDIDNGVAVQAPGTGSSNVCALNTSVDPNKQERGTRTTLEGNVLTLAFNPQIGFSTVSPYGGVCTIPAALTSVAYGNLQLVLLQPKDDPSRKRSLDVMVAELASAGGQTFYNGLACPSRARAF
jgi:hypothetical protein